MKRFKIFQHFSELQLTNLSYVLQEEKFARDQIVYRQGVDTPDRLYMVKYGEFQSYIDVPVDKKTQNAKM